MGWGELVFQYRLRNACLSFPDALLQGSQTRNEWRRYVLCSPQTCGASSDTLNSIPSLPRQLQMPLKLGVLAAQPCGASGDRVQARAPRGGPQVTPLSRPVARFHLCSRTLLIPEALPCYSPAVHTPPHDFASILHQRSHGGCT